MPRAIKGLSRPFADSSFRRRDIMEKKPVRIELTEEQKKQVREATGKEPSAIELTVEELETSIHFEPASTSFAIRA